MPNAYRNRDALDAWSTPHELIPVTTSLGETTVVASGEGEAVCVYLPAADRDAATSLPLLDALGEHFRVWAVDLPGQQGLGPEQRPRKLDRHRRWLRQVLKAARADHQGARVVLLGVGRGAAIGLHADPGSVHALALVSPAGIVKARWAGFRAPRQPRPLSRRMLKRWRGHRVSVMVGELDRLFEPGRLGRATRRWLRLEPVVVEGHGRLLFAEAPGVVADAVARVAAGGLRGRGRRGAVG